MAEYNPKFNYLISIARPHNSAGQYMVIPHAPGAQVRFAADIHEARRIRDEMWGTPREDYMAFKVRTREHAS